MHRAATALQQQAKDMQANLTRVKSDKTSVINKSQLELKTTQVAFDSANDPGKRSRLAVKIQRLQDQIVAAEQEIRQAEADLQRAADGKKRAATDVEGQAKQLDSQASTTD